MYPGQITNCQFEMPISIIKLELQVQVLLNQVELFFILLGEGYFGGGAEEFVNKGCDRWGFTF